MVTVDEVAAVVMSTLRSFLGWKGFPGTEREVADESTTTDDLASLHAPRYRMHLSRFLTPDPVAGGPARTQSFHPYAYALNNPLRYTDPWGLDEEDINGGAGGCDQDSAAGDQACTSRRPYPGLGRAIEQTLALSLSAVPSRDAVHEVLEAPVKEFAQVRTNAWEGRRDARDTVTVLSFGGFLLRAVAEVTSSSAVIQEQLAIQAHIAALGGVSEPVATGFLGSGLTTGTAGILVVGTAAGGMGVGRVIRRQVIPDSWNRAMGDGLHAFTQALGFSDSTVEGIGNFLCPGFLCGR